MKSKGLLSIVVASCVALLLAGTIQANVPAPPTNQIIGIADTIFNNLAESECRVCHTNVVNDHHLLYQQAIPQGACSFNDNNCIKSTYCDPDICANAGAACTDDNDCDTTAGELCGEVCIGESALYNPDADRNGSPDSIYTCLSCHPQVINNGVISFVVIRDCVQCHKQIPGQASVHHLTPAAQSGECKSCHGDFVDNRDDGHYIPTYAPSLLTPVPSGGIGNPPNSRGNGAGACNYCHDSGNDNSTGDIISVVNNEDTHHNTGVFLSPTGVTNQDACLWCHPVTGNEMRVCENCHGVGSLHNIQTDSPKTPTGTIVVGGEDAGYGHIGRDAGAGDSDCWGCHGNYQPGSAPDSGPVVPFISGADIASMTAGTATPVTLTGTAFTNMILDFEWISEVLLTAAGGTSVTLTPDSISEGSLTVTIPGTTSPGKYTLQAVKGDLAKSNPLTITVTPKVAITAVDCNGSTLVITGSGFGDVPPEGAEEYLNAKVGGMVVDIIYWTDTQITASTPLCSEAVTVNALYGSASTCDCEGNFDGDAEIGRAHV